MAALAADASTSSSPIQSVDRRFAADLIICDGSGGALPSGFRVSGALCAPLTAGFFTGRTAAGAPGVKPANACSVALPSERERDEGTMGLVP